MLLPDGTHTISVFIDSGADENFMDTGLATQLGLTCTPLPAPAPARALDGHVLDTVTHRTEPVPLLISGNHHETVSFHVISAPQIPLILGYPWLKRHNPHEIGRAHV